MEKILTVSVAAYHVEDYLEACLSSFVAPDFENRLEVLVINDGAGEEIDRIAMKFVESYPTIFRLIQKENGGHGSTVNRGIEEASGLFFKTVDGDDMVNTQALRKLLGFLEDTEADLVVTNYETFDDASGSVLSRENNQFVHKVDEKRYDFEEVADKVYINMHAAAFRTSVLKKMPKRLDEHCFYVDAEYILYPIPFIKSVVFLEETLYRYRLGLETQSMHIKSMQKNCSHHETVLEHLLEFYREYSDAPNVYRNYIAKGVARIATSQMKIYLSHRRDGAYRQKLLELDERLRKEYPNIYQRMTHPALKLLRRSRYRLYPFVSFVCRKAYHC